jgi:hypothetical protein
MTIVEVVAVAAHGVVVAIIAKEIGIAVNEVSGRSVGRSRRS